MPPPCPSVKRFMMYQQGCFIGGTILYMAKDLAENNKGARVLALFGDDATVVNVDSDLMIVRDSIRGSFQFVSEFTMTEKAINPSIVMENDVNPGWKLSTILLNGTGKIETTVQTRGIGKIEQDEDNGDNGSPL
ncbi:unnamed protein product [Fraxinus pennsylvanica]|uniref:chalcone synthase n=1 Tax=Fraxinus pennsylvanica TaxID=56036 RepID=A0AAD1YPB4_9LAMI|nr:unnamed protein product [Fraxinus pennsylvanica]